MVGVSAQGPLLGLLMRHPLVGTVAVDLGDWTSGRLCPCGSRSLEVQWVGVREIECGEVGVWGCGVAVVKLHVDWMVLAGICGGVLSP